MAIDDGTSDDGANEHDATADGSSAVARTSRQRRAGSPIEDGRIGEEVVDDGKYSRVEYERRFLVRGSDWRARASGARAIEDKYLHGTRLRLRVVRDLASGTQTIKLTRKAASPSAFQRTLNRILLTPAEQRVFDRLAGDRLTKVRRHCVHDGHRYAVDEFDGELAGLVLCEVEAGGLEELMRAVAPPFAEREVTTDPFFDGVNLARATRAELLAKLASLRAC